MLTDQEKVHIKPPAGHQTTVCVPWSGEGVRILMKLMNQQVIKNNNLKRIYNLVYKEQGISRAALAKRTRLSKTTVSALVDELLERKFLMDTGTADSTTVGRKPNSLQLLPEHHYVAVLCWEENQMLGYLMDICGTIAVCSQRNVAPGDSYVDHSRMLFGQELLPSISPEELLGICIVVPAMIDPDTREIISTTFHLPDRRETDLVKELSDVFRDYPTALLNDTACTAYAEKVYTGIQEKDFAFINFSRGIGATLFIQNVMLGNATASYTQFGHYSIDPHGPFCSCGNRGCLERMIGEDSIPARLAKAGGSSPLKKKEAVTYKELGQAAIYGDAAARSVIRDMAFDFSVALGNLVCTVHPKLIIIGGKGRDLGPLFLEDVSEFLHTTGFRRMLDSVRIRYGFLEENACCNGAMKYFFDIHYNFTQDLRGQFFIG